MMMDAAAAASSSSSASAGPAANPAATCMKSVVEENPSNSIAGEDDAANSDDNNNNNNNNNSNAPTWQHYLHMILPPALLNLTAEQRKLLVLAALGVALVFPGAMIRYLASLLLRIGGTAVGIGLGLGLAAHIHDELDGMADRHWRDAAQRQARQGQRQGQGQQQQQWTTTHSTSGAGAATAAAGMGNTTPRALDQPSASTSAAAVAAVAAGSASSRAVGGTSTARSSRRADLFDDNSYHALMASAGYDVPDGLLRGQILRTAAGPSTAVANANADIANAETGTCNRTGTRVVVGEQKRPITAATILENTVADGPNEGRTPNPLYPASVPDAFANFASVPTPRGPSTLKRMYPTLPTNICHELGTFMDLIMRDFIHCWFCTIDPAVLYEDEKERRQRVQAERERQAKKAKMMEVIEEGRKAMAAAGAGAGVGDAATADAGAATADADAAMADANADAVVSNAVVGGDARRSEEESMAKEEQTNAAQTSKHSLMVLSTAPLRPSPFPEALYATMATLFGSLAVNARDNVNIMELILVKVVRVLSLNIKTYRELRKFAVNKHRRRLASARGRVKRVQQSSSTVARDGAGGAGAAELRSATSHDRLDTTARSADAGIDAGLQRKSSLGSLVSPPGSGNGTFEGGLSPRERGQSFGASSTSGDHAALPSESEITEIAMIREYLLAGKLHRAITFGMDVPSLLFADPHGRDCPPPSMEEDDNDGVGLPKDDGATATGGVLEDDDVLYARLFSPKSQLMVESELDYCRILSHRLIKETTTKVDFDSSTLRSMAVEMVASCVLAPIMSCFSPDMINYGLIKVLEPYSQATSGNASTGGESEETKLTTMDSDMDLMRGWDQSSSGAESVPMEEETELAQHVKTEFGELEEADDLSLVETFDDIDAGTISGDIDTNQLTRDKSCQNILTLLTMSLIALQEHLNFGEIKLSRESNTEVTVNWDAPNCRAAVRRLVLVVEAALLHGLRTQREREQSRRSEGGTDGDRLEGFSEDNELSLNNVEGEGEGELLDDDDVEDVEQVEDAAHLHPTSIIVLLMELTEDLDAFEKRVSEDEGMGSSASLDESEHSHDDANDLEMHKIDWTTTLPPNEVSSLRTLIAAWLHTGQLFRTLSVFLQSRRTILRPFYHSFSFMRDADAASGFVRQLKVLDGIDILVDTAAVLRCQSLDLRGDLQFEPDDVVEEEIVHDIGGSAADSFFAADGLEPGNAPSSGDAEHPTAVTSAQGLGGSLVGGVRANLRSNRQRLSRLVTTDLANVASTLTGSGSSHAAAAIAAATPSSGSGKSPPTPLTAAVAAIHMQHQQQNFAPHLTFSRNAAFAENLRKERDRRMASWEKVAAASHQNATVDMIVHTRGLTDRDVQIHRELHGLARAFYSGSVVLNISQNTLSDEGSRTPQISMENVANRRRFEVPDDDSSFLLRASSRRLTPLGVTRNARDHSQSYISFLATYQEPILHPKSKRYKGGRYIRHVEIKFFPSNKTATVSPRKDDAPRHMHANLKVKTLSSAGSGHSLSASKGGTRSSSSSFLSSDFQKTRHLCQRHLPAGSGNVLTASMHPSLMDSDDFVATPRVGKAYDFVYRFHLFEKPVVDIGGKQFTVQDSSLKGVHKADASALEISDATLSYALLTLGESIVGDKDTDTLGPSDGVSIGESGDDDGHSSASASASASKNTTVGGISLQQGEEGSPTMILMKIKAPRGTGDTGNGTEKGAEASFVMRPFRPSFLRAALLQTSTRQEAQLQCLLTCVKAGSARNATRARTEALLQPYLTLLEFAVSKKREKQSILLRDLKLGINHIDVDQLRRNAILNPRYPTVLHSLSAVTVEGAIKAKASNDLIGSPAMVLYKIRVSAIVEEAIDNDDSSFYREDWVVLRPFRDFVTLHKYLKKSVNEKESSGNAGAKLVGAAAAALTFSTNQRQRPILIPSLGQAKELGALGVTQKSIEKRREILSQYLSYLTDPKHLLHQCPELMRFLGASDAFPEEQIDPNAGPDSLGRIHLKRTPLSREVVLDDMMRLGLGVSHVNIAGIMSENTDMHTRGAAVAVSPRGMSSPRLVPKSGSAGGLSAAKNVNRSSSTATLGDKRPARSGSRGKEQKKGNSLQRARLASIKSQVEQVSLSEVRNGIFRFIRFLFDLEGFRNRILSTLKTISLAVTSAQEFHKLLFRMHLQHASAEAWAGWISFGREILWPEGIFFESAPPQDPEELKEQEKQAKSLLLAMFPEQIRAVLSEDIAMDGIGILHEMLQNRVVLRSMSYMLMDEVYASIFPALNDVVTGCSAVDVQDGP